MLTLLYLVIVIVIVKETTKVIGDCLVIMERPLINIFPRITRLLVYMLPKVFIRILERTFFLHQQSKLILKSLKKICKRIIKRSKRRYMVELSKQRIGTITIEPALCLLEQLLIIEKYLARQVQDKKHRCQMI